MRFLKHALAALAAGLPLLTISAALSTEHMVGLAPSDGVAMFVKQFSLNAGATILGAEFENNDSRTVFPEILLVRGAATSISAGTVVAQATNVQEASPGVVSVTFDSIAVTESGTYLLAVRIPEGAGKQGQGDGPALGATATSQAAGSFVAGGSDGDLTPLHLDLSIRLLTTGGVGKPKVEAPVYRTALTGAIPNPFNPTTKITFSLNRAMPAELTIYNVMGRKVRNFGRQQMAAGPHQQVWDGRNDRGQVVGAGIYVVRLIADGTVLQHKVCLVK